MERLGWKREGSQEEKLFICMDFLNLFLKISKSCLFINFSFFGKCFVYDF